MIIVTIVLLLAFYITMPIMLNSDVITKATSSYYDYSSLLTTNPKIGDVIGFESLLGLVLILLIIGVGALLCTVCKRKEGIAVGIVMSIAPSTIFITQLISYLLNLTKTSTQSFYIKAETIVTIVLLAVVALYSVVLGVVRLLIYLSRAKKAN